MPHPLPDSIVVSITACHAVDRGSIIKETDNNLMIILSLTRLPVRKFFFWLPEDRHPRCACAHRISAQTDHQQQSYSHFFFLLFLDFCTQFSFSKAKRHTKNLLLSFHVRACVPCDLPPVFRSSFLVPSHSPPFSSFLFLSALALAFSQPRLTLCDPPRRGSVCQKNTYAFVFCCWLCTHHQDSWLSSAHAASARGTRLLRAFPSTRT